MNDNPIEKHSKRTIEIYSYSLCGTLSEVRKRIDDLIQVYGRKAEINMWGDEDGDPIIEITRHQPSEADK